MILEALTSFSRRMPEDEVPPPGCVRLPIKWEIKLGKNGELLGVVSVERTPMAPNPDIEARRTSKIKAGLFADTGEYVFGKLSTRSKKKRDPERIAKYHEDFLEKVKQFIAEMDKRESTDAADAAADARAVLSFVSRQGIHGDPALKTVDGGDWVTFTVDNRYLIAQPEVRRYWIHLHSESPRTGTCMVCGCSGVPLVRRHPVAIRNVPGTSGPAQLISANDKAYYSYGLEESFIAPMCRDCAERSHNALNYLIATDRYHFRARFRKTDALVYLFWTREPDPEFDPVSLLNTVNEDDVKRLFESVFRGKPSGAVDESRFYGMALSGARVRVVVSDWIDTTVSQAKANLARYFDYHRIIDFDGSRYRYVPIMELCQAASNRKEKTDERHLRHLTQGLVRVALLGTPMPDSFLHAVLERCRVSQNVRTEQAALIKLALLSTQASHKGDEMTELNNACTDRGYLCGRLLALFSQIQRAAHGREVGSNVVDRFYGTASVAPGTVFPGLMRLLQNHLGKIRSSAGPGLAEHFHRQIEDVTVHLDRFPKVLRLQEQGMFALGFYHQRAQRKKPSQTADSNQIPENEE